LLIRKEKIIGLQVYDKKGRYVGTVKDIGFVLGENLVGIVVVGRDNREIEFIWSEVEAAEDIVILKKEVTVPVVTPAPKKPIEIQAKPVLKEQPIEKPQTAGVASETEVQIASKTGVGEASELPLQARDKIDYVVQSQEEVESVSVQPDFESSGVEETPPSNTKTCPKCGAINNARYKFCFRCGTRLS